MRLGAEAGIAAGQGCGGAGRQLNRRGQAGQLHLDIDLIPDLNAGGLPLHGIDRDPQPVVGVADVGPVGVPVQGHCHGRRLAAAERLR